MFPTSINDIYQAISAIDQGGCSICRESHTWGRLKSHATNGIMLAGGSVGGYLATMAGIHYLKKSNKNKNLRCIANSAAPLDMRNIDLYSESMKKSINDYFGKFPASEISPVFILENTPTSVFSKAKIKWVINYNKNDKLIPSEAFEKMAYLLKKKGMQVKENISNDYAIDEGHNISNETKYLWAKSSLDFCFTAVTF